MAALVGPTVVVDYELELWVRRARRRARVLVLEFPGTGSRAEQTAGEVFLEGQLVSYAFGARPLRTHLVRQNLAGGAGDHQVESIDVTGGQSGDGETCRQHAARSS